MKLTRPKRHHGVRAMTSEISDNGLGRDGGAEEVEKKNKEVGASEDESQEEGSEEEGRQTPKIPGIPKEPTEGEKREHEALHIPHRPWCRHCVRGRGRNRPHRNKKKTRQEEERERGGEPEAVAKISLDYFFMSQADQRAAQNPMIVMTDGINGNKYMRAVGQKGMGAGKQMEWLIKDIHEELKAWGRPGGFRNKLIMKSDGERAIVAVREALSSYHGGEVTPEQPPKGEHQANGEVEEAGKTVRDMVKVLKDQLEFKAKVKIEPKDVVMQWMVRWAAMLISRYKKGKDNNTPHERQKGKACEIEVVPFGEYVFFRKLEGARGAAMEVR